MESRRLHLVAVQLGLLAFFGLRVWASYSSVGAAADRVQWWSPSRSRRLSKVDDPGAGLADLHKDDHQCGSISKLPAQRRCEHASRYCRSSRSLVNYAALHYCHLGEQAWLSVPLLGCFVALFFLWLAETAEFFFSPVAGLMVEMLRMSPTMGGVTLLALGNGAPDVFASMAAIGGGNSKIGLGAIISAGTFVSAFVVGSVACVAAPFSVKPVPFVRDVLFYTTAVAALLVLYLKGVVARWQAVGMVLFYAAFIIVVVFMDQVKSAQQQKILEVPQEHFVVEAEDRSSVINLSSLEQLPTTLRKAKLKSLIRAPLHAILRATIPETDPSRWNRLYATANIVLCPLLVLFMFRSVISFDYPVTFILPGLQLPVWSLLLVQNILLGTAFFLAAKQPPDATQLLVAFMAFVMSVFWISFIAGELLGCLSALGVVSGVPPALLGLTVLAWGNSMGDLVADIAIARAGKPDMAVAGCFAGPMFNMLVGLGSALVVHTSYLEPPEYYLPYNPSIVIAFGFLFTSLLGSLLVVASSNFCVTRLWGLCLIALYFVFTVVSLLVATVLI